MEKNQIYIIGLISTLKPDPIHSESKRLILAFMGLICSPLNFSISSNVAVDKLIVAFENGVRQSFYHFQQVPTRLIIMH